jgi:hypothetical protein
MVEVARYQYTTHVERGNGLRDTASIIDSYEKQRRPDSTTRN